MTEATGSPQAPPVVQVVSGRPDDHELAALVAVLLARTGARQGPGPGAAAAPSLWGAPATLVRRPHPLSWSVVGG